MKRKQLIIASSVSLGTLSVVATSVAIGITSNNKTQAIKFDNHWFNSYEAAASYYIAKNYKNIAAEEMLGDVDQAMVDPTYYQVNKDSLYDFSQAQIYPAFESANGNIVNRYDQASSSFANRGLATEYFTDGITNKVFQTEVEALRSRDSAAIVPTMGIIKLRKPSDERSEILINPTNKHDLEHVESLILEKNSLTQKTSIDNWLDTYLSTNPSSINVPNNKGWGVRVYKEKSPGVYGDLFQDQFFRDQIDLTSVDNQNVLMAHWGYDNFNINNIFKNVIASKTKVEDNKINFTYGLNYYTGGDSTKFYYEWSYTEVLGNDPSGGWHNVSLSARANSTSQNFFSASFWEGLGDSVDSTKHYDQKDNSLKNSEINYISDGNETRLQDLLDLMASQYISINGSGGDSPKVNNFKFSTLNNISAGQGSPIRNWNTLDYERNIRYDNQKLNKIKLFNDNFEIVTKSNYNLLNSIKVSGAKIDTSKSILGVIWTLIKDTVPSTWTYGSEIYTYTRYGHLYQIGNLEANLNISRWFNDDIFASNKDVNLAKIYVAHHNLAKDTEPITYITYNGKPIYEGKKINGEWTLDSLSDEVKSPSANAYNIDKNYSFTKTRNWLSNEGSILKDASEFIDLLRSVKEELSIGDNEKVNNTWVKLKDWILNTRTIGQLHTQELINGTSSTFEYYKQYLFWLLKYIRINITEHVNLDIVNKIVLPEEIVIWEDNHNYENEFIYRRYLLYDSKLFNNQLTDGIKNDDAKDNKIDNTKLSVIELINLEDNHALEVRRNMHQINISRVWVVFDQYGNQQVVDSNGLFNNAIYDDLNTILNNIRRENPVRVSRDYVYIKDGEDFVLVSSNFTNIYKLTIEEKNYYFATHEGMVRYIIDYIKRNAKILE